MRLLLVLLFLGFPWKHHGCLAFFITHNTPFVARKIHSPFAHKDHNHHHLLDNRIDSDYSTDDDDDNDDGNTSSQPLLPRRRVVLSSLLWSGLLAALPKNKVNADDTEVQQQQLLQPSTSDVDDAVVLTRSPAGAVATRSSVLCEDPESRRIDIFQRTAPSVVFIDTFTEQRDIFSTNVMEVPLGSGSGFVWDDEGHIVTNFHVVRNANAAQVAILINDATITNGNSKNNNNKKLMPVKSNNDDTTTTPEINPFTSMRGRNTPFSNYKRSVYIAKVVGVDPNKDIAVLKVDAPRQELFPITLGTSTGLRVGQQSLAIGNPFGLDHTLTAGIISGIGREVKSPSGRPISNVIQTDAAINPGNSGGPLLDAQGRLIGMNTAIYSPSGASAGIGFAIPVDTVKYIVETLIRDGKVVRPILGISLLESKQAQALGINSGVLVLDVPEQSPAYKAGMRGTRRSEAGLVELGDIITKVGDEIISDEGDLFKAVDMYKIGDKVKVTVVRVEPSGRKGFDDNRIKMKELVLTVQLIASTDFIYDRQPQQNQFIFPGR